MSVTDTHVTLELKLADGASVYSCHTAAGVPYIFVEDSDGNEVGALELRKGHTKAGRIMEAVFLHFEDLLAKGIRLDVNKVNENYGTMLYNLFAEKGLPDIRGRQIPASYSKENYPDYQDTSNMEWAI